ncbi:MAG: NAD(P)-binding domain-containing protein [Acidobacteria bacterium]|nr:NAD(P)-binding domain-containing protein [Acidobacteriota bacterium]
MLRRLLESANMPARRPELGARFESSLPGVHVIGDLAGAPLLKLAMEQGRSLAEYLASIRKTGPGYDVVIAGAGAAGLNCALALQERELRVLVLEKARIANTIYEFPEAKMVYDEPVGQTAMGPLWLGESRREELLANWHAAAKHIEIHEKEPIIALERTNEGWLVRSGSGAVYKTRRVVIATGQSGTPRKLGVPGEDAGNVHHRLYNPSQFAEERIVVVGGGNSAVEAALVLAARNDVTLVHRGQDFHRLFKANREKLDAIKTMTNAVVESIGPDVVLRGGERLPFDRVFVLIGSESPAAFLQQLGLRMENDWSANPWLPAGLAAMGVIGIALAMYWLTLAAAAGLLVTGWRGNRWSWLALSLSISYTVYAVKGGDNNEFWPFKGWGHAMLSFGGRPWSFWYTVLFTALMTVFGIQAAKRWGWDRGDRFQMWRYASLIGFQWIFFFLIPEFLFRIAVQNQWLGEALARDSNFTNNLWRSYGLVYAWPLFFYTFFGNPHKVWIYWGLLLSFGIIPLLVIFHGKRYCSWVCGCGGLAETFGDRWRHLAPKGDAAVRWERMNSVILGAAVIVTLLVLGKDTYTVLTKPAAQGLEIYHLIADVWLAGILPVGLYPFLGGKMWCRYWCPLAKMMELFSAWYTRIRWSRFSIQANEKCIACGECTRNCQVGIDVMKYAMLQREIDNVNSSCIGCGICITVCPMDVLHFGEGKRKQNASSLVQIV